MYQIRFFVPRHHWHHRIIHCVTISFFLCGGWRSGWSFTVIWETFYCPFLTSVAHRFLFFFYKKRRRRRRIREMLQPSLFVEFPSIDFQHFTFATWRRQNKPQNPNNRSISEQRLKNNFLWGVNRLHGTLRHFLFVYLSLSKMKNSSRWGGKLQLSAKWTWVCVHFRFFYKLIFSIAMKSNKNKWKWKNYTRKILLIIRCFFSFVFQLAINEID